MSPTLQMVVWKDRGHLKNVENVAHTRSRYKMVSAKLLEIWYFIFVSSKIERSSVLACGTQNPAIKEFEESLEFLITHVRNSDWFLYWIFAFIRVEHVAKHYFTACGTPRFLASTRPQEEQSYGVQTPPLWHLWSGACIEWNVLGSSFHATPVWLWSRGGEHTSCTSGSPHCASICVCLFPFA